MDFRRLAILALMDVLLLIELTSGIWWSHFEPAAIAWRFSQVFVPSAVATLLVARCALRRWAPERLPAAGERPWRPVGLFGALDGVSDLNADRRG
jgi:hypothetical protein